MSAPDPELAQQLLAALQGETPTIVCYSRCWSCQFGQHYDPPRAHPWADDEDREHARATGQPEPTGNCACRCAKAQPWGRHRHRRPHLHSRPVPPPRPPDRPPHIEGPPMTHLAPTWLRLWRCRSCGARHTHIWILCPYTNQPKDLR